MSQYLRMPKKLPIFKLEVADFAKLHVRGLQHATVKFQRVQYSTAWRWSFRQKTTRKGYPHHPSPPASYGTTTDVKLAEWVLEQHDQQFPISMDDICDLAWV